MDLSDPNIQSTLIAASVTLLILILKGISKPVWERSFHNFKIESEHKYAQRKAVREAISRYKVPLLNAGESLNHRMWNFSENTFKGWHQLSKAEQLSEKYYLVSFCYRFLLFFAISNKIERELIYLDSTVSTKEDLKFLRYMKFMPQLFCDVKIFEGQDYDPTHSSDHFFSDDFKEIVQGMWSDEGFITYSQFREKIINNEFEPILLYLSGVTVERSCLRWQALSGFHFILMAFLNDYGYDFQSTSIAKYKKLSSQIPANHLASNIKQMAERMNLSTESSIKPAIAALGPVGCN